jgi:hypothetical protein
VLDSGLFIKGDFMKQNLILIAVLFSTNLLAFDYPTREVTFGGEPDLDACGGFGYVLTNTILITKDENRGLSFDTIVKAGTPVSFCDPEGDYYGVVVEEEGKDCGTNSPVPEKRNYDGPCKSGWIKKLFLLFVAG